MPKLHFLDRWIFPNISYCLCKVGHVSYKHIHINGNNILTAYKTVKICLLFLIFNFIYLLSVHFCKLLATISQLGCFHRLFVLCLALEVNFFFSELLDYVSPGRFHFTKCRCLMYRYVLLHFIPGSPDRHFRKRFLFLCKVETWSDTHKLDTSIQLM